MPFVKRIGVWLWEFVVEQAASLLIAAIKALFYAPLFYGLTWLVSHHAPSHEMWYGFIVAVGLFTSPPKKANSRPKKRRATAAIKFYYPACVSLAKNCRSAPVR